MMGRFGMMHMNGHIAMHRAREEHRRREQANQNLANARNLGLKDEDLLPHSWRDLQHEGNTGSMTLSYLNNAPEGINIRDAMSHIKGMNGHQIRGIMFNHTKAQRVGFTPNENYSQRLDDNNYNRIVKPIIEKRNEGAGKGAFSQHQELSEVGGVIGSFLTMNEGEKLSKVNRAARREKTIFQETALASIRGNIER